MTRAIGGGRSPPVWLDADTQPVTLKVSTRNAAQACAFATSAAEVGTGASVATGIVRSR